MIKFETTTEVLEFLNDMDGYGLIATDDDLMIERIRDFDLIDDYLEKTELDEER